MTTPSSITEAEYAALNDLLSGGDISACSKADLERFAVMLSRPSAYQHFDAGSFLQLCETVRTLLTVRMSEQQNEQAKRESRIALVIAVVALLAGIVQATLGYLQYRSQYSNAVQSVTKPSALEGPMFPTYSEVSKAGQAPQPSSASVRTPTQPVRQPSAASNGASP